MIRYLMPVLPSRHVLFMLFALLIPVSANALEDKLKHFTLPNGLNVFVKEDSARKVAAIQLWVKVGSADENDKELGISHLIEHMAFKGTERRGVGKIAAEIEALGGDMNAYTSWDETVFHVTVPSSAASQGMDIITDAVLRPVIDPGELDKEKQVVIEEILEGEERPERKSSKLLFKTAYTESPYQFPIIGYKEGVEKFSREDVLNFRKKWYVPDNMFLVVVGDVSAEQVRKDALKFTEDIKPVPFFRPPRPSEPPQKGIRTSLTRDANSRETRLHIAYHIPSIKGVDVNALDLTADILGARDNSRLIRILKNEKGLVNSISVYSLTPKEPGLMIISATLDGKNLHAVTKAIMEEISRLAKEPPSKEELQEAKTHMESQHIFQRETVQGIARSLGNFQADLGDANYEWKYLSLNSVVTPEEISKVTAYYMSPPNISLSILMPENSAPNFQMESLVDVIADYASPESVKAAEAAASSKMVVHNFPNGLKAVLIPDDSNPVVSFRIASLGGKRFENKDNEGIMNFISRMIDKGAGKMSEVDIARKVDSMGGRLDGFSGFDSFGVYASFSSKYTSEGLRLLHEIYTNPTFPKDKVDRERNLTINRIKTEPDRPVPYTINILNGTVFKEHPYGFDKEGTIPTVSGFSVDELKAVYKRFAVPANTVITVVGDIDTKKTLDQINELFGKLKTVKFQPPLVPAEEPLTDVRENVIRIPRAKAHISVGFRGTKITDPDKYPLEVLNNILAGQGGRLFVELRDKESLAYVVTSFFRPGVDNGVFAFYIATDYPKVDQALKGVFREIDRIKEQKVEADELSRSINNLVGNHLIALQSSSSRAENTALNTLYGLGPEYDAEYVKKISEVKSEDVQRVAQKYLDTKACAIVKVLPEENEGK